MLYKKYWNKFSMVRDKEESWNWSFTKQQKIIERVFGEEYNIVWDEVWREFNKLFYAKNWLEYFDDGEWESQKKVINKLMKKYLIIKSNE